MAKAHFHPLLKHIRGKIQGLVFRLSHNGETSVYATPNMSRVKWSQTQDAHRERMAEAFAYGSQATRDPEIREHYLKLARQIKNNNRPYDMAVWDYYHNGNNLLGKRFYWNVEHWRAIQETRKSKKKRKR